MRGLSFVSRLDMQSSNNKIQRHSSFLFDELSFAKKNSVSYLEPSCHLFSLRRGRICAIIILMIVITFERRDFFSSAQLAVLCTFLENFQLGFSPRSYLAKKEHKKAKESVKNIRAREKSEMPDFSYGNF